MIASNAVKNWGGASGYSSAESGYESPIELEEGSTKLMPMDVVTKILDNTDSFELIQMLIAEVLNSYDKLSNIDPVNR